MTIKQTYTTINREPLEIKTKKTLIKKQIEDANYWKFDPNDPFNTRINNLEIA